MCAAGRNTGSLDSLVFVTCDNGSHDSGQFTEEFVAQYKARHEDQLPDLQCPEHPMNEIIKVCHLQTTLHAGSSSCAFDKRAFANLKVKTIPLWNWEGKSDEWWRQCWVYTGILKKEACRKDSAGPFAAGGEDQTLDETPFCIICQHTATSNLKGKAYHPPTRAQRRFKRKADDRIKTSCFQKGLTLMWETYDTGCPNVYMTGDFNMKQSEVESAILGWRQDNPLCPYTPVFTRNADRDKDYVLFFSESGASRGYFGNNWHKWRSDRCHFPIMLNANIWFPAQPYYWLYSKKEHRTL